jgi:hypothetical protein
MTDIVHKRRIQPHPEICEQEMNVKLLIFLTWIFYIAARRTADEIWHFCLIYSAILSACAYLFKRENKSAKSEKKKK